MKVDGSSLDRRVRAFWYQDVHEAVEAVHYTKQIIWLMLAHYVENGEMLSFQVVTFIL